MFRPGCRRGRHTPSAIFLARGAIIVGFESLDTVDLAEIWKIRAILMQSVPKFLDMVGEVVVVVCVGREGGLPSGKANFRVI